MRKTLVVCFIVTLPALAQAGGFEILEHSAAGIGMAAAQTAAVSDPAAVFYNPAAMTFQRGLGVLVGAEMIHADVQAQPKAGGASIEDVTTSFIPTAYAVQRLGSRFALGIGGFAQFGNVQDWPNAGFPGRFLGTDIDLETYTINPSLAIRPVPWLSFGFGLDIMLGAVYLRQGLPFGGGEGAVSTNLFATGVGGNLGVLVRVVPRWLDFAFTYRSAVDLDFDGHAALDVPLELAGQASTYQNSKASVTMPHNMSFALASHLAQHLVVDADVHVTLWSSLQALTLTLTDPKAPAGMNTTKQSQLLNWRDTVGVRLGFEYRVLDEQLILRIGGGYDRTPVPQYTMGPLTPDADRGVVSAGIGYHSPSGAFGIEVGYMAVILPSRPSLNPGFLATYHSLGQVVGLSLILRAEDFGGRINEPDFRK